MILKNIQDFLNDRHEWIQQESTFWKRSLWEKAGGCINEEYKFSIDTDLWARFFLHERLYHLNSIIASKNNSINDDVSFSLSFIPEKKLSFLSYLSL